MSVVECDFLLVYVWLYLNLIFFGMRIEHVSRDIRVLV